MASIPSPPPIGIRATASYVPEGRITIEEIASRAGVSVDAITQRFAMKSKPIAEKDEQPSDMSLRAARAALEKSGIDPADVDLLIVAGTGYWDYPLWPISARLHHELGLTRAFAFEVVHGCLAGVLGLHVAQMLLLGREDATTALVVSGEKSSAFIDHADFRYLPVWHHADGAVAAVVQKGESRNRLLGYRARTVGSLHNHLRLTYGGTKQPVLPEGATTAHGGLLHEPAIFDKQLSKFFVPVYKEVIEEALRDAGRRLADVRYFFTNQANKAVTGAVLQELGLTPDNTFVSIEQFGHMSACDPLFGLISTEASGSLKSGDTFILGSATAGFTWGALVVEH